jgi:hypothetical protein
MSPNQRDARGQYQVDANSIKGDSLVGSVVREEFEVLLMKVRVRLNALSAIDLIDEETSNFKDDIRSVLGQYLGGSTAKVAVNFVKNPNSWNVFCQENYARVVSELQEWQQSTGMIFSAL